MRSDELTQLRRELRKLQQAARGQVAPSPQEAEPMDGVINDGPPQPTHVPASTPHVLRDDEEYYQVAGDLTPVVEEVDFGRPRTVWVRKPA